MPYPTNNPIDGRTTCTCKQPAAPAAHADRRRGRDALGPAPGYRAPFGQRRCTWGAA